MDEYYYDMIVDDIPSRRKPYNHQGPMICFKRDLAPESSEETPHFDAPMLSDDQYFSAVKNANFGIFRDLEWNPDITF